MLFRSKLKDEIVKLQNEGELGILNFNRCSNIIAYGSYVPEKSNKVNNGTDLYFYYEPRNVFTNIKDGLYEIWFTQDMIILADDDDFAKSIDKKDLNEKNIQPLSDDYIKFIRYAEHYIEKNGQGIVAYISNNSFIDFREFFGVSDFTTKKSAHFFLTLPAEDVSKNILFLEFLENNYNKIEDSLNFDFTDKWWGWPIKVSPLDVLKIGRASCRERV